MFRSATSNVSAVSGCVAKGRQTVHHVSCSPSKIPYVGFSPVRLQTGIQPRPSSQRAGVKLRASIRPDHADLYAIRAHRSDPCGPCGHVWRDPLYGQSSPEVLRYPVGYVVPQGQCYYDLIRNSLGLPPAYLLRPGGSLPDGLVRAGQRGWAGPERLPNLLRVSVLPCRRPYPGGHGDCS